VTGSISGRCKGRAFADSCLLLIAAHRCRRTARRSMRLAPLCYGMRARRQFHPENKGNIARPRPRWSVARRHSPIPQHNNCDSQLHAAGALKQIPQKIPVARFVTGKTWIAAEENSALSSWLLCVPCEGTVETSVQIRPGQLSLRPEAQGAVQEVTNGLKHFLKRPRRRSAGSAGRNANEHRAGLEMPLWKPTRHNNEEGRCRRRSERGTHPAVPPG
jgi:hypothetical protein